MNRLQVVKDILAAIESVRSRAKAAQVHGDLPRYRELMGDLCALEVCLVSETESLVAQIERTRENIKKAA